MIKNKCDLIGGCGTTAFLALLFIVPFSYNVVASSEKILLDKHGNISAITKQVYCLFDKQGFYEEQKELVLKQLESEKHVEEKITRLDIDMKKMELSLQEYEFEKDYKEPLVDDLPDDTVADIIRVERRKESVKNIQELTDIMRYINKAFKKRT
ncbi:hypothetical protein [Sulfurimonas sp.]|uniref:hypothetical protein n=1 Tax=Sulfurimonas sp. TaxID=2022749 RepID=UPI0019FF6ADD|nr:hypothetical protein [Sulfurimonas sp.]MBE0515734.1 hypothetical protein [Sulfurimonas sp.]